MQLRVLGSNPTQRWEENSGPFLAVEYGHASPTWTRGLATGASVADTSWTGAGLDATIDSTDPLLPLTTPEGGQPTSTKVLRRKPNICDKATPMKIPPHMVLPVTVQRTAMESFERGRAGIT